MATFQLFFFTVSISVRKQKSLSPAQLYESSTRINGLIEENKRKQDERVHFW